MSISDFAAETPKEPTWDSSETPTSSNPTIQTEPVTVSPVESTTTESTTPTVINEPVPTAAPVDEILNSILGHITPIGQNENFKMLIYGDPGTTKSSFCATAPNNLIVDLDEGLISAKSSPNGIADGVRAFPWIGFPGLTALIHKLAARPAELDWVQVLTIDPFSETHKRGLDEVLAREHMMQPSKNRYMPVTENHTENNNRMLGIIRDLKDLDRDLIITAHARTVEPKGQIAKTFPDFSESLANKIEGMMDIVGYMFRKEVDGVIVPVMRVVSDGNVHAKTRVPLPVEIMNPTYPQIKAVWDQMLADKAS